MTRYDTIRHDTTQNDIMDNVRTTLGLTYVDIIQLTPPLDENDAQDNDNDMT